MRCGDNRKEGTDYGKKTQIVLGIFPKTDYHLQAAEWVLVVVVFWGLRVGVDLCCGGDGCLHSAQRFLCACLDVVLPVSSLPGCEASRYVRMCSSLFFLLRGLVGWSPSVGVER